MSNDRFLHIFRLVIIFVIGLHWVRFSLNLLAGVDGDPMDMVSFLVVSLLSLALYWAAMKIAKLAIKSRVSPGPNSIATPAKTIPVAIPEQEIKPKNVQTNKTPESVDAPMPIIAKRHFREAVGLLPLPPLLFDNSTTNSWVGGLPAMPPDIEWPIAIDPHYDHCEYPMHFLAQIDCSDIPRIPDFNNGMPDQGALAFFTSFETGYPVGRVIYLEGASQWAEHPCPPNLGPLFPRAYEYNKLKIDRGCYINSLPKTYLKAFEFQSSPSFDHLFGTTHQNSLYKIPADWEDEEWHQAGESLSKIHRSNFKLASAIKGTNESTIQAWVNSVLPESQTNIPSIVAHKFLNHHIKEIERTITDNSGQPNKTAELGLLAKDCKKLVNQFSKANFSELTSIESTAVRAMGEKAQHALGFLPKWHEADGVSLYREIEFLLIQSRFTPEINGLPHREILQTFQPWLLPSSSCFHGAPMVNDIFQMGGWARGCQGDLPAKDDEIVLLSLGYNEITGMMFGDHGDINFVIKKTDLAKKDFSKARVIVNSG